MTAEWLAQLNPAQREAATHGDGPILVIAGAGTGKTRTLAARVAYLLAQGVAPEKILLLTFTRRASAEMIRRAEQMTGTSAAGKVWGGTFHAVANRLLRIYGRAIDLNADFTVIDQADAADMMNYIRAELGVAKTNKRFPKKQTLVSIYSRAVNAREKLAPVLKRHFPWCQDEIEGIRAIFEQYTRRKREHNTFDYDDLLLFWNVLCTSDGVAHLVGDRFEHVLVDEFQDTNAVQAEILKNLRRNRKNIMVVGDDAQSIYSFRAATVRNILDFPQQYENAAVVKLEQNYRSVQSILAASNAVMQHARQRYTKDLWSQRPVGEKPSLVTCLDETEQCTQVCERILAHYERGMPLMRQAVLFRTGWHSNMLEVELARRNIPFHKYGGLKFIEAAHVKDMLAFLRILENPRDQLSWFRVLLLLDGIGPAAARRIYDHLCGVPSLSDPSPLAASRARQHERTHENTAPDQPDTPSMEPSVQSPLHRLFHNPPRVPASARDAFERFRQALQTCAGLAGADDFGDSSENVVDVGAPLHGEGESEPRAQASDDRRRRAGKLSDADASPSATSPPRASTLTAPALSVQIELLRRFYEPIFESKYDNATVRLRDLEQLEQIAQRYKSRNRFITDLTLDPPASTADLAGPPHLDEDYLILSTIHSAKGCEWDAVHVLHVADGMIPSDMSTGDAEEIDEERRLLYVAMTRAKDHLYLYFPLRYYHRGRGLSDAHGYAQLTRFIPEEDKQHYQRESLNAQPTEEVPPIRRASRNVDDYLGGLWAD